MMSTRSMDNRQLIAICICFGLIVFEATITLGVMPVYVVRLGADSIATGFYLAFNFFGATVGNILGGWLTDRIGQHKRFILFGFLVWIPTALLIMHATTVAGVTLLTGLMWLPGGVVMAALYSILGLSAGENERGRVFGWVSLATGIGALIAGLIGGTIAEQWGFPALFIIMAAVAAVMFLIATTIRDVANSADTKPQPSNDSHVPVAVGVGSVVYLLLLANFFAHLGPTVSDLGRPLVMLQHDMNTIDVSSAIAVSSALILPLPLILGWLSDRIGRKRLLILFYGFGALGILLLTQASAPWHFWLSAALVALINASNGVGQAYIADLSDSKVIGRSLSLFSSSNFVAAMIGLSGGGYLMQGIGINRTLLLGAFSLVIAIMILLRMRTAPAASATPAAKHQTIEVSTV